MDIEPIPAGFEEIERVLAENGSMSFVIDLENKYRLYRSVKRLNKADSLIRNCRTGLDKLLIWPYLLYIELLHSYLARSDVGFRHALLVYQAAWQSVKSIDGAHMPNKTRNPDGFAAGSLDRYAS